MSVRTMACCGLLLLLLCAPPAHAAPRATPTQTTGSHRAISPANSYALSFAGKAESFDLSGFEPDFDPIYRVIVSGTLHDQRAHGTALPDATLVLSAYLESFTPDTTPVLPDLLHPDQQASDLGGFLQGKTTLVNAGGHIVYRGSLLAEIFTDNSEHLVVDLDPVAGLKGATSVRLQGMITLHKGGAEDGTLHALQPLARAALAVPRGPAPSWQTVMGGMSVHRPAMLGNARPPAQQAQPTPPPVVHPSPRQPLAPPDAPLGASIAILILGAGLVCWRLRARRARRL